MINKPKLVVVHPIVLLSIVDHYNRVVGKNKNQRVVGVILGESIQGKIDVTNCYAIPFEEDLNQKEDQGGVWFADHVYHETMYEMFRKINAKEKIVGWYTTGTKFKKHDLEINEIFRKYTPNPVLVIIDVEHSDQLALPTESYCAQEEIASDGKIQNKFHHIPSTVEALEPEEIGVEHLLREIKDISLNSLTNKVHQKIQSLQGMMGKILQIKAYLDQVLAGKILPNQQIMANIQEILNYLPNINNEELMKAFTAKNNDNLFVLFVCSLTRSIISLHTLMNNKLQNKDYEKEEIQKQQEKKEQLEKEKNKDDKKKKEEVKK